MPKQKTNSSAKKRMRVTGTGKIMREGVNNQHKFEGKTSARKRRVATDQEITGGDRAKARKLLGKLKGR
ncbi:MULTISPECIES: 50S ribosomal protein L35 [Brevibacterium]|jgi:large subunit ribosomal protein L35|uniref:50S ribosomal protein L35 n=1 Tax=Brevibacterium TaxID=1696 RepID=UPI001ADF25F7|nr:MULTISPECIES: 50S ribosomal protein L35 [Brevibacterium]QUL80115.1 50S ribosomal protein L35 [Brevibacterium sp. SMBL_HHYL_HB1]HJA61455.1 50S ribosomal protein L35 [Candidatus Brevibacterium intestinavium]